MDVNLNDLEAKLKELYPEIEKYNLFKDLSFDQETNSWILTLKKGEHELKTHLEKKDVEGCLGGTECVHLGIELGRFVDNYCRGDDVCHT